MELYDDLKIVSDLCFEKNHSDTFTAKTFREQVAANAYEELILCGLDECGCVGATAQGAVKEGIKVKMLTDCIGRRFPEEKVKAMRDKLTSIGVEYM